MGDSRSYLRISPRLRPETVIFESVWMAVTHDGLRCLLVPPTMATTEVVSSTVDHVCEGRQGATPAVQLIPTEVDGGRDASNES